MKRIRKMYGASTAAILIVVLLIVVSLAGGAYLWDVYQGEKTPSTEAPVETPGREISQIKPDETLKPLALSPTPPPNLRPIATGARTYAVSGKFAGPAISSVTIDPLDAKAGQSQKISVKVSDTTPVTRVYVTIKLDTKSNTFDLKLASGTQTDGIWEGSAPFPDDTLYQNYQIIEVAQSSKGTTTTTTSVR